MSRVRASGLVQLTEAEPLVSIDDAREHLRLRHNDDDPLIARLVDGATEFYENRIGRQLMEASFRLELIAFPCVIELPRPPAKSVTKIEYVDTAGDLQTLAAATYQTDLASEPARIMPAYGEVWPSTRCNTFAAVQVTFVAGYGTKPGLVPEADSIWILAAVERMYRLSSGVSDRVMRTVPMAAESLAISRKVYA
ncbi:MAG: phage head-tail connector protein [Candidatus Nanopelagicales bacterium]|nr:phage head-tail connector protein [Candidatus Nanopelagicales bacterium]